MFPNPLRRLPESFVPLLALLLISHIAIPLAQGSPAGLLALTAALLLAGVPAVRPSPGMRLTATLGLAGVLVLRFASLRRGPEAAGLATAALLATAAYVTFIATAVFAAVIRRTRVDANTVMGAVCVYLLVAHVFALLYYALEVRWPGSIAGLRQTGGAESHLEAFLYFSVITLATVGFGDIVPVAPTARSLVTVEAILGQFFMAVFVARLVGSWLSPADAPKAAPRDS